MNFEQAITLLLETRPKWEGLAKAARDGKDYEFLELYADFLKNNNLVSADRVVLYNVLLRILRRGVSPRQLEFEFDDKVQHTDSAEDSGVGADDQLVSDGDRQEGGED